MKIKNKSLFAFVLILLLPLIFIFVYFFSTPITNVNKRDIPVEIIGDMDNENVKKYIKNIDYIDDYLIKLPHKIIFTARGIADVAGLDKSKVPANANAVTIPEEMTVYINTDSYDSMTLMHEFFHLYDVKYKISSSNEFLDLVKKYGERLNLTPYQASCREEIFVGCMLKYRYQKENLRSDCVEMYSYIEEMLEENNGLQIAD